MNPVMSSKCHLWIYLLVQKVLCIVGGKKKKHAIKCGMGSNEMQSYRDSARNRQYTRQYKGECVITRLKD